MALHAHQPLGQLVQARAVAGDVAQQRHRLGGQARGIDDDRRHVAHLGLELGDLVEIDRGGGGLHLVDRIVHRADQAGDRAAVERRQEGLAHGLQHFADDVVGIMLALDRSRGYGRLRRAALEQPRERVGAGDDRHGMRLEQLEEIARLGQQALEPGEHVGLPSIFRRLRASMPVRRAAALNSDAPNERIRSRRSGSSTASAASASVNQRRSRSMLLLPVRQLVGDREREDIDIDHQRRAVAARLAIAIRAERGGADRARDPGLLLRLPRGGGVRGGSR